MNQERSEMTFDIPMEFALCVQIVKSAEKLSDDDCDVLFPKYAGFHLCNVK
jgi:hypothetical protein